MSTNGTRNSAAIATVATDQPKKSRFKRAVRTAFIKAPFFAYLLVFYVILKFSDVSLREVVFYIKDYQLTWVEVLYLVAIVMAMTELLRVSKPRTDNTLEALCILGAFLVFLVLFVLAAAGVRPFRIFGNTEFLMLLFISGVQMVMGFVINSRTLKVTIDNTATVDSASQ